MAIKSRYSDKIQVNVTHEQMEEVKSLSDDQGVSYAEVVRQALEAGLPVLRARENGNASVRS